MILDFLSKVGDAVYAILEATPQQGVPKLPALSALQEAMRVILLQPLVHRVMRLQRLVQ